MSGSALKWVLSRAQVRLADRSDACEGPGWARTEHMQQESGYVVGVPKMAAGAEAFLEDAGCWQASLQNARELLEAAGSLERENVHASVALADVWMVLERGLLLDRLKKARRRGPRRRSAGLAPRSELFSFETSSAISPKGPGAPLASPRAYIES